MAAVLYKIFFSILVLWLFLSPIESFARDTLKLELDGTFLSRFVWRGEMWTDDPVYWQTVTFRYRGFRSYNFFNIDLTDINHDKYECNEYDYILDYTFSFYHFSIAPGVLRFTSPTNFFATSTKITLDVKTGLPFQPRLRIRIDPYKSSGSYYIFSFARTIWLKEPERFLTIYGSLGMSQPRYYRKNLGDRIVLTDALLGVNVPFSLGGGFVLTTLMEFTSLLDSSVRKAQDEKGARKDAVTYGVTLSRLLEF
ncbi:MAG: hypothetical protein Q8O92_09100 [Candidatus Latescibacter sp.]|nr:hypothetical protein [Candidatus Latescibacter sp.]